MPAPVEPPAPPVADSNERPSRSRPRRRRGRAHPLALSVLAHGATLADAEPTGTRPPASRPETMGSAPRHRGPGTDLAPEAPTDPPQPAPAPADPGRGRALIGATLGLIGSLLRDDEDPATAPATAPTAGRRRARPSCPPSRPRPRPPAPTSRTPTWPSTSSASLATGPRSASSGTTPPRARPGSCSRRPRRRKLCSAIRFGRHRPRSPTPWKGERACFVLVVVHRTATSVSRSPGRAARRQGLIDASRRSAAPEHPRVERPPPPAPPGTLARAARRTS